MEQWWNALSLFQQIMVFIAFPSTLIIIVQMVLLLFGFGSDDSFDTVQDTDFDVGDMSADTLNNEGFLSLGGIKVFTLRGILALLSVGGWLAMALSYTMPNWLAGIIGLLGGLLIAFLIALAFHYAMKLQSSGNLNYNKTIGSIGTVYMRIPPNRTGIGKINLTLQERYVEIDAVSDDDEYINTGLPIKVTGLENNTTVIVERIVMENKQKKE